MVHKHQNRSNLKKKVKKNEPKRDPKHPKALSDHHILPRSRGGSDNKLNLARVIQYHHSCFHSLFANMTPIESLAFLEIYFFGTEEWTDSYSKNRESIYKGPEKFIVLNSSINSYHYNIFLLLFDKMNPFEIFYFLENYFWNKQRRWVNEYVKNRKYYLLSAQLIF